MLPVQYVEHDKKFCMKCSADTSGGYQQLFSQEKNSDGEYEKIGVLCYICSKIRKLNEYDATKELSASLITDAALVMQDLTCGGFNKKYDRTRIKPEYVRYVESNSAKYFEINNSVQKIQVCIDLFCQTHMTWICNYLNTQLPCRGYTSDFDSIRIFIGNSAGRILVSIQDKFPESDERNIFGGAYLTIIFLEDVESDPWNLTASIQGICATEKEACQLLVAASKALNHSKNFVPC